MLVTPLSTVARHRLEQCAALPSEVAHRVCQIRFGTTALFPELATLTQPLQGEAPCPCCGVPQPTGTILAVAEEVRALHAAANMAIDQCHVDPPSLSRRLLAMCASRPMAQTRVAFVALLPWMWMSGVWYGSLVGELFQSATEEDAGSQHRLVLTGHPTCRSTTWSS